MLLKEIQTLDLLHKVVVLRFHLLENSQHTLRIYIYPLDISSELGNSSESADSQLVSQHYHHHTSKLKILVVVPWLCCIDQKQVSLDQQRAASTPRSKSWDEMANNCVHYWIPSSTNKRNITFEPLSNNFKRGRAGKRGFGIKNICFFFQQGHDSWKKKCIWNWL